MYELYLCLVPRFVQGRARAVMPFVNGARRGLHHVEGLERQGGMIARAHCVRRAMTDAIPN